MKPSDSKDNEERYRLLEEAYQYEEVGWSNLNHVPREKGENLPKVERVAPVAPDILAITIQEGEVINGEYQPYEKQEGDRLRETRYTSDGPVMGFRVVRDGKEIGFLAGGPDSNIIYTHGKLVGDPLDKVRVDLKGMYKISSGEDSNYSEPISPEAVYRKSIPNNTVDLIYSGFAIRHTVFLKLPHPLEIGKTYTLDFGDINVNYQKVEYRHDPENIRSEAVHTNQVGYRPDDPGKKAFLSIWLGTGGAYAYDENTPFYILDYETREKVYEGKIALAKGADEAELMVENRNYNLTNVYQMEFGDFNKPGKYQIYVEGVGCSYPFEIGEKVWETAFKISMKGFYHQRSGIELGPPYTSYKRPRPFHPDDGLVVYQSTTPLMDSGNGLNAKGTDTDNFGNLVAGKTDEIVENAWGGYFDAGDWDRRIQHLDATRLQLELLLMFPEYFEKVDLNIPESDNDLPDLLDEALWNLDFYRRLQTEEGGVRGGIESEEHPRNGEASWMESLTVLAYAPGIWSSYIYSGVAARAAYYLKDRKPDLSEVYKESALRAMEWAEERYPAWKEDPTNTDYAKQEVRDERNLAAIELYRLTGDKKWNDIFMQDTRLVDPNASLAVWGSHNQRNAAFVYATLDDELAHPMLKKMIINAIIKEAKAMRRYAMGNAFNLTAPDQYRSLSWGFYGAPDVLSLVRAHYLTGEEEYLKTLVQACQFSTGANPMNMSMTTGVGYNYPKNPLHIDSRRTNQKPPIGITVFGNCDLKVNQDDWFIKGYISKLCTPDMMEWPYTEAYFDTIFPAVQSEFTVNNPMGYTAYVWGYLAARK